MYSFNARSPDLDPNRLTLKSLIVLLKEYFEKDNLEKKNSRRQQKHEKLLSMERVNRTYLPGYMILSERSGSVVECLTRDRRAAGSSLTGVTGFEHEH